MLGQAGIRSAKIQRDIYFTPLCAHPGSVYGLAFFVCVVGCVWACPLYALADSCGLPFGLHVVHCDNRAEEKSLAKKKR